MAWESFWLNGTAPWEPPVAKSASDSIQVTSTEVAILVKADLAQLFPDAILTQTNIGGTVADIDDDPDSPDANWMAGTGAVVLRVSFPTPSQNLKPGFPQEFRVRVRP